MGLKVYSQTIPHIDHNIVDTQKTVNFQNSESQDAQALERLSKITSQAKINNPLNQFQNVSNEEPSNFETIGGTWRKNEKEDIRFYRTGEDISNTNLFDNEYFKTSENEFVRLNKKGALIDNSPNKGKVCPDGISDFDWYGWEKVSVDKVPAEYTTEGKTVSFADPQNAQIEMNVFKRYIVDNAILNDGIWDEARVIKAYDNFRLKGGKIEVEESGQTADGKTQYKIKMDDKSLEVFRGEINSIKADQKKDAIAAEKARTEVNQIALDHARILYNSGVGLIEGTINLGIDSALSNGGTNPIILTNPYRPQVRFIGHQNRLPERNDAA